MTLPFQTFGQGPTQSATGVILYMDAFGPRPALCDMARRMAAMGHLVTVPDLFHRFGAYGPFDAATAFSVPKTAQTLRGMIGGTSQAQTLEDTDSLIAWYAAKGITRIAAVGYCMGGGRALLAATRPEVVLAASFHGGNLASDAPDSPHRAGVTGRVYVGSAEEDRSFPPEQSAALAQALREKGIDHMIENYPGCAHGWCVPDHSVFDEKGAARHWARLEMLFAETLSGQSAIR